MTSIELLQSKKSKIDLDIAQCKAAIREMTAAVREKGRFAPVKQYNDLQIKLRRLGQDSQNIQHEIGAMNRARKESNQRNLNSCFVTASKSMLPQEQFLQLMALAYEMSNGGVKP